MDLAGTARRQPAGEEGYRVYHDITADGFNIDHVVVGPAGVFVIETKFRGSSGVIEYRNGEGLFINNRRIDEKDRDPLKQARGSARAIRQQLKDQIGRNIWTKAMLVYVGVWQIKNAWRDTDVAVMTADKLIKFFERQDQPELLKHEIELIASHLERSARS